MELSVIGNSDFVTGFRLAGIRKIYDTESIELDEAVRSALEDDSVGILIMHNDDVNILPESLKRALNDSVQPTVVTLGGGGDSSSNLREKIKQAVGVDLWK
ncbi:MAG: V-type ATP synthase subunit F [Methanosarcinaceae archaeon]|nr:V-type ATP synthase subunit F [Methanosarcinaceae archaeon]